MSMLARPLKWPPVFPVDKDLILDLRFDERSGSKAYDRSGRRNNGSLTGGSWAAGARGSGLKLSGSLEYVTVPYAGIPDLSSLTIECLIQSDVVDVGKTIFSRYGPAGVQFMLFWALDNTFQFYINGGSGGNLVKSTATYKSGVPYVAAGTFNGVTKAQKIYINGVLSNAGSQNVTLNNPDTDVIVGEDEYFVPRSFDGFVGSVRIYDCERSADELKRSAESELLLVRA